MSLLIEPGCSLWDMIAEVQCLRALRSAIQQPDEHGVVEALVRLCPAGHEHPSFAVNATFLPVPYSLS
jgi:hypothetical protein